MRPPFGGYPRRAGDDDGEVLIVRMFMRLVVWGLGVYGAKRLYDKYAGSAEQAKNAGAAIVDRVGRASALVREQAQDAASNVAAHALAATQEVRGMAGDVADLAQPASPDDEQSQARQV
jgi:hypothetical protein